jgi:hypothetical protein
MAGARAGWVEKTTQERSVMLASAHREADEVAQKACLLEGELVVERRARDTVELKLLSLVDLAARGAA